MNIIFLIFLAFKHMSKLGSETDIPSRGSVRIYGTNSVPRTSQILTEYRRDDVASSQPPIGLNALFHLLFRLQAIDFKHI